MLPFTFVDKNEKDKYNVGLYLLNKRGENILTPNNFAFLVLTTYTFRTAKHYLLVPGGQNSSTNLTTTTVDELKNFSTAVLDTGKEINIIRCDNFIELDENNEIIYPFKSINICFSPQDGLICNENTLNSFVSIPIYAIEQGSLIQRIKDLTNVDIYPIIKLFKEQKPKVKSVLVSSLETYIQAYKNIPEFRKCIENNIQEVTKWVKYSLATVKRKSKEMVKLFEREDESTIPEYIKTYIAHNNVSNGEKNIFKLYNIGFTEDDFSLYDMLIGSYKNTYVQSFLSLYDFINDNNKENPKYSVSDVLKMIGKNKTASRKFFTQFNSIQSDLYISSKYSLLNVTELKNMIKSYIVNRTFVENADAIRTEIENFNKKSEEYSLRQYPELTIPNEFFDYDFDIYRFKEIKDIKSNQEREMWDKLWSWSRKLKEGEIAFFVKKDNEYFMGITNLISQTFDLYCLHFLPLFNNKHLAKIVDKNESCGYFNEHLDTKFIEKLQSCLSKYFYEPFAKIRLNFLFSN